MARRSPLTRCRPLTPAQVVDLRWRVLRAGRPRLSAVFDGDADALHHGIYLQDALVGVVSLFYTPLVHQEVLYPLQLRGMAVAPEHQGQGIGRRLLSAVVARTLSDGPLWCNARVRAQRLYAGAGWRPIGGRFDVPKVGPHQRMVSPEAPAHLPPSSGPAHGGRARGDRARGG